jgi:hypothetical protein
MHFNTKAEVAEWCQSHIKVDIIWQLNPITLMNMASTKICPLCAAKCMVISHNFNHPHLSKKILNLKNELRGICYVRQGSYGFCNPSRKGGSYEGEEKPKNRVGELLDKGGCIF